jgi:hypothetical protein
MKTPPLKEVPLKGAEIVKVALSDDGNVWEIGTLGVVGNRAESKLLGPAEYWIDYETKTRGGATGQTLSIRSLFPFRQTADAERLPKTGRWQWTHCRLEDVDRAKIAVIKSFLARKAAEMAETSRRMGYIQDAMIAAADWNVAIQLREKTPKPQS